MARGFGRNVVFVGAGWFVAAVVAFVAVPITIRGLGDDAWGVTRLVLAVTGYLALLELGFRNGILRYVSMFVARGEGRPMRQLLWLMLAWFALAGFGGAVAVALLAPWLVESVFKVPVALVPQAVAAFRIGGVTFALTMVASVLSAVPETFLRYDIVSPVNMVLKSVTVAGPAVLVLIGFGLVPVMWFGLVMAAVTVATWSAVTLWLVGGVPSGGGSIRSSIREFTSFSLHNGVNSIWTVVQMQTNGVVVGIAGGTAQAGYFGASNEISNRVNDLLNQMSVVLFPTGSQMAAAGEHEELLGLYERSSRMFYVVNASVAGAIVVFCAPLLGYWIGPKFATEGAVALAFLTLAQALNATSMSASRMNLALGRPRVNLIASVSNSIINLGTVYFFTVAWGITGTALSGLVAAGVVPFFLDYSHRKVYGVSSWAIFRDCYLRATVAVTGVSLLAWLLLLPLASAGYGRIVGLAITLGLLGVTALLCVLACGVVGALTAEDRASIFRSLRSVLRRDQPGAPTGPVGPEDEPS